MHDHRAALGQELLSAPTDVMRKYLEHFSSDAALFIDHLNVAARAWEAYSELAVRLEDERQELVWSAAYLLNGINAALISTRLLLAGYIVASGNQARHALESLAFGVLIAYPKTGAYAQWKKGHSLEYKALEYLSKKKNAELCGVNQKNVDELRAQAKWFDVFSHPSRAALASIWNPVEGGGWSVGSLFVEEHLPQYRQEMANRVSLAQLLLNAIAGTHAGNAPYKS